MIFGHDVFGLNGFSIGNQIFHAVGTEDAFTGDKVKVFQHCMGDSNFSDGWVKEWGEGEYDEGDFENDDASALWIPEGYTVVASQHYKDDENFPGKQSTWEGPLIVECLAVGDPDKLFNDDISNFKITYVAPTTNGNTDDTEDDTEDVGTNWLLYGGIAAVAAFAFLT